MDGRYRLLDRLGAGGMSVVWRAHDDVLDRDVAVKVLSPELASDPDLMHRIRSEARAAARLRHPNVIEVHDFGEMRDDAGLPHPYVVMELVDGRSLAQMLTGGALPWRLAVLICAQVAAALAAAHRRGIVHRDVKPGNVMVTAAGVKLVDFGISATIGEADGSDGQVLGTPAYLAPERLDGGPVRPATDVYALGLLLYRVLAGRLPWRASTTTQMLAAHRYQDPADLPPVDDLPAEVADLCHLCLSKQPTDRPTAADVARILGDAAGLAPALLLLAAAGIGTDADDFVSDGATPPGTTMTDRVHTTRSAGAGPALRAAVHPLRLDSRRARAVATAAGALVLIGSLAAGWGIWSRPGGGTAPKGAAEAAAPAMGCTVRYATRHGVGDRASTAVTIVNTGPVPVSGWQLTFAVPAEQRLLRGWAGVWTQDGRLMRARGDDLPAGGSVATGFDATYRGVNALPAGFQLNGSACRSVLTVADRPEPSAVPADKPRTGGTSTGGTSAGRTPTRDTPTRGASSGGRSTGGSDAKSGNSGSGRGTGKGQKKSGKKDKPAKNKGRKHG